MVGTDARQAGQLVWSTEVEEKRSRVAGERSWTQRTTWEGRGHSFIELAEPVNGAIAAKMV